MKLRGLDRHMKGHGCRFERESSNHTLWKNPATGKVAPVPQHREVKEGTARAVCAQQRIPKP
ncbi:MAG: type II toxin-antitoxin system HicA family toxin [Pedosphaera sp.]|nr:type II toxin-antitoxin system HicA family toxin [Pedosphaera sp.]